MTTDSPTLAPTPTHVAEAIRTEGFAWISTPLSDLDFVTLARSFGTILSDTPVRVIPGKQTYLARPDPVPLHTDHPQADLIAWRCEAQDAHDGASRIVDGWRVLEQLDPSLLETLATLRLPAMVRLGDESTPTPIRSGTPGFPRLFYAPWLEPLDRPLGGRPALHELRRALVLAEQHAHVIRLQPGHVLIIDNHRMLHGRDRLLPDSTRRLRRLWLTSPST